MVLCSLVSCWRNNSNCQLYRSDNYGSVRRSFAQANFLFADNWGIILHAESKRDFGSARKKRRRVVAHKGTGFFDRKGKFFKTAREATESDLAALFGQIGEGESLAPGIAHMLLEKREQVQELFNEHDTMTAEEDTGNGSAKLTDISGKVTKLSRPAG